MANRDLEEKRVVDSKAEPDTHLEVVYDPVLGVYFDPVSKKYYKLK